MAVFSTNQVRHLYVAKTLKSAGETPTAVGDILPVAKDDYFYFKYVGQGGPLRSDLIKVDHVKCAKYTKAADQKRYLTKVKVTLNAAYLADGNVIPGQDYILRIVIRQFAGMSDEDTYIKYGAVHGTKGMTAAQFYEAMAKSLEKNFKRELTPLLKFTKAEDGLTIEEVEQDWILGTKQQTPVYFDVFPTTITYDGEEVIWGNKEVMIPTNETKATFTAVPNSKNIADLEYFCMGERGDIYRNVGWPNVIPTKYMVDAGDQDGYDVLDIHYYFEGAHENPQKSEKDLTIVAKTAVMNAIVTELEKINGLDIKKKTQG